MKRILLLAAALALPLITQAQSAPQPAPHSNAHTDMTDRQHAKPPVPPSKSVTISFQGHVVVLTVSDLLALPQVTVQVHNAHRNVDESYTGPLVSDVFAKAGFVASKETEPLVLHSTVVATATDHYFVVYSAAEMLPTFATGKAIVAVMKSGLPDTEGGLIQLINTADAKPARWVHGLTSLNVVTITASTAATP